MRRLFLLLLTVVAFAGDGYGVNIFVQSPESVEYRPGEIFTSTIFVENMSGRGQTFVQEVKAPEGWQTIPDPLFPFDMREGGEALKRVTVKIPNNATAGMYVLRYRVQSVKDPDVIGVAEIYVHVLESVDVVTEVLHVPARALAGKEYTTKVRVTNHGNVRAPIRLDIVDRYGMEYAVEPEGPYILDPGESQIVSVTVKVPKKLDRQMRHHVEMHFYHDVNDELFSTHSVGVDLYPRMTRPSIKKKYRTMPIESTGVFGMRRDKKSLFVNTQGGGPINEAKTKNIDFLFRIPIIDHSNVYRMMGGAPEKYFFHYKDPQFDVYAGDGLYSVSPLIMTYRYARGASVKASGEHYDISALYLLRSESLKEQSGGGYVMAKPTDEISLSGNYLFSKGRLINAEVATNATANSYSVYGNYNKGDPFELDLEFAGSGPSKLTEAWGKAMYTRAHGQPWSGVWYDGRFIYASPSFVGYYQDMRQWNTAIGFPIWRQLRATGTFQEYDTNLCDNPVKDAALRSKSWRAELSYPFFQNCYANLSYNTYLSKDPINLAGYRTDYGALRLSQTWQKFSYQAIAEVGQYENRVGYLGNHAWHQYQFYAYIQPTPQQNYTLYTRLGYDSIRQLLHRTKTYGASVMWATKKGDFIKVQYEYSERKQQYYRNFYQLMVRYRFKWGHSFNFRGLYWEQSNMRNTLQFIATYTVPWDLGIGTKKDRSGVMGRVLSPDGAPQQDVLVSCGESATLTDGKGRFYFPDLAPGMQQMFCEPLGADWVTGEQMPSNFEVPAGKEMRRDMVMLKAGTVSGKVALYEFAGEGALKGLVAKEEEGYLFKEGLGKVRLVLEREGESHEIVTDSFGGFTFDRVRPGKWTLQVHRALLPEGTTPEEEQYDVELLPSQEKTLEIKILPKKRYLRMIQ